MRSVLMAISVAGILLLATCQRETAAPLPVTDQHGGEPAVKTNKVLKIKVTAGEKLLADGQPVTLEQLPAKLSELKNADGVVWYHRENAGEEPHPNGIRVIDLIIENRLPMSFSANPDFSDWVDDKVRLSSERHVT